MEFWKRPVLRVPLVLIALGLLCRTLTFLISLLWGYHLRAQGPDPETGSYLIESGPTTLIILVLSCLLFWLAGWLFVRGLSRRQIFWSASIMVLINAALLTAEQISWAEGWYFPWVYYLFVLAEGSQWVGLLLCRIFDAVSLPLVIVSVFTPYLYLIFGKKERPYSRYV